MTKTKTAEKLIKEKSVHDMTDEELDLVEDSVKMAWFESGLLEDRGPPIDFKKRTMGEWALGVLKDNDIPPGLRAKIKNKYKKQIKYYLDNVNVPEASDQTKKFAQYLADIEFERQSREIVDIVNN